MPPEDPQKPNGRLAQFLSGLWSPDKRGKWLRQHGAPVGYCLMHLSEIDRVQGQMTAQQQVLTAAALALGPYVKLTRGDLPAAATMAMESAMRVQKTVAQVADQLKEAGIENGDLIEVIRELRRDKDRLDAAEVLLESLMCWKFDGQPSTAGNDWTNANQEGEPEIHGKTLRDLIDNLLKHRADSAKQEPKL